MDMQKIGIFLSELRKENNLTQEALGEKIGVTNKTISRWENENNIPPVEMLQILSKMYDDSINEILSGERLDGFALLRLANTNDNTLSSTANAVMIIHKTTQFMLITVDSSPNAP